MLFCSKLSRWVMTWMALLKRHLIITSGLVTCYWRLHCTFSHSHKGSHSSRPLVQDNVKSDGVESHVCFESIHMSKCFLTDCTAVRFLPGVCPLMSQKGRVNSKVFFTGGTVVRLLSCVRSFVRLKSTFLSKGFVTE